MSVDTYDCACCKENGVYEEYIACCEECGQMICSDCIINELEKDNRPYLSGYKDYNDGSIYKQHCPFCSGDKISEKQRFEFLLNLLNKKCIANGVNTLTIEDIDHDILTQRKENKNG